MRALVLALALAACGGGAAAPKPVAHVAAADEEVRITIGPHAVGDRRTRTTTLHMDAETTLPDGRTEHVAIDEHEIEEAEVLEVEEHVAVKVRVTYAVAERRRNFGDLRSREDKPVKGHTYVVWHEGDAVHVTRDDGTAPRDTEEQEVLGRWRELGRVDPLLAIVASQPWTLGVRRDLRVDELELALFGDGDGTRLRSGSIALAGTSAATATFELHVVMLGRDASDTIEVPATIVLEIERRSGRLMSATLTGTMRGVTEGVNVTGTVEASQRSTYR